MGFVNISKRYEILVMKKQIYNIFVFMCDILFTIDIYIILTIVLLYFNMISILNCSPFLTIGISINLDVFIVVDVKQNRGRTSENDQINFYNYIIKDMDPVFREPIVRINIDISESNDINGIVYIFFMDDCSGVSFDFCSIIYIKMIPISDSPEKIGNRND